VGSATEQIDRISAAPGCLTGPERPVASHASRPAAFRVMSVSTRTEMLILLLPAALLAVLAMLSH
jgi:hypothetical protein